MFIILGILIIYFLNISILFQNQSLVVLLAYSLILIVVSRSYKNLKSTSIQLEILEWIENIQFYQMVKLWTLFSIRARIVKLYNVSILAKKLKDTAIAMISQIVEILHSQSIEVLNSTALLNLRLLLVRYKTTATQKFISNTWASI
jgi:hypothetical protein